MATRVKCIIGWGNSNWRGEALVNAPAAYVERWFSGDATEIPNSYRNRISARFWQVQMPHDFAAASGGSDCLGTATSFTSTTMTVTGSTWVVNALTGKFLVVTEGSGDEIEEIVSNTADEITVASWTGDTPDGGVRFAIYDTDPRKTLAAGMAIGGRWHDVSGEVVDQPHYITGYEYPSHQALPRVSPWQRVQARECGQGIEIAHQLSEHWGERVYMIHLGVGGTTIRSTTGTGTIQSFSWFNPTMVSWHPGQSDQLYDALMAMVTAAAAAATASGLALDVRGIFCTPGENEAAEATNAANAGDNLAAIIAAMRADIVAAGLTTLPEDEIPVVLSGVPDVELWDYVTETNESMQTAADADLAMRMVNTLDLTLADGVHYDADGAINLADRMVSAFLGMPAHATVRPRDKCLRPDEWVLMDEIPGAGADPIIGYTVRERPSLANPVTGKLERPPTTYTLAAAAAGNPYVPTTVTATASDIIIEEGVEEIVDISHTLYHAERSGEVTRWVTAYTHNGTPVEVGWLRQVDLGQSFNQHRREYENHLQVNIIEHNPDAKGADMLGDQDTLEAAPMVYYKNASGGPGAAFAEACTVPIQFDPSGEREGPDVDHGGSETVQVAFWRERQYRRYDPCFPVGHTFRGLVNRGVFWNYVPTKKDPTQHGGHLVCLEGAGPAIIDIFDEGYMRNLATGVTTAIEDWDDSGNTEDAIWSFTTAHYEASGDVTVAPTASPIPEGYGAAIFRDPATDFTIGIAFKLAQFGSNLGNGCTAPNWCYMGQARNPTSFPRPTDHDDNSGQVFLQFSRGNSREIGWQVQQFYVYTGPYDHVEEAMDAVYAAGLLDADPPDPPNEVLAGTLWPRGTQPVSPIRRPVSSPESVSADSGEGLLA